MYNLKFPTALTGFGGTLLLVLLSFTGYAQSEKAWSAFDAQFKVSDVGNLHVYSPTDRQNNPDFTFYGTPLDRGLYGLFAANWRDELPEDFKTYALYKIRYGSEDAYLMRFSGSGTQNMIAMFTQRKDRLVFVKTLSSYYCNDTNCWQMDSWIQDFDGDTRLDILQKARVEQFRLMGAPVDEYTQVLRQRKDGTYYPTSDMDVDLDDYDLKTDDGSER